jgi:hypothetical protein
MRSLALLLATAGVGAAQPPFEIPRPISWPTPAPRPIVRTPAGYPPAPAGYSWVRYPDSRWGLLQDGVQLPTRSPTVTPVTVGFPTSPAIVPVPIPAPVDCPPGSS